jgi:ribosomal protein S18 acetylase RimI-like enzyme
MPEGSAHPASLRMRIDLPAGVAPGWPDEVAVRTFREPDAAALHALLVHGYRHGGGSVAPFATWLPALTGDEEFDPDLVVLAEAGDRLAAASICWTSAFVKDLVVHEGWRRRGLGEALLQRAFRTFSDRGAGHVDLKVEADNEGAIRLYERVGMRVVERLP